MMVVKKYYVYIMTNRTRTLYIGVTNDLERRVMEHKLKLMPGFTSKYNITQLIWYQDFDDINQAIAAEKTMKAWRRSKKIALIEEMNPDWTDLAANLDERTVPMAARTPRQTSGVTPAGLYPAALTRL